jgi:dTDP-glucose 4,6-dehydratase
MENIKITEMILKKLEKPKSLIKPVTDRPAHDRRYSLDCEKLKQLGWKSRYNFESALNKTIDWYKKNEKWWRNIKEKQESFRRYYKEQYSNLSSK